jgi:ketosteroid isomerase-like protein
MSQENVETLRRGYELLAKGDVDGMAALIHPEFELRPVLARAAEDAVYRGLDGLREYVSDMAETWERFDQHIEEFIDRGEDVVAIMRVDARGRGSGVEVSQRVAVHYTFSSGKALRGVGYTDPGEALEAVGPSE